MDAQNNVDMILSTLLRIEMYSFTSYEPSTEPAVTLLNIDVLQPEFCSLSTNYPDDLLIIQFDIDFHYETSDIYVDDANKTILSGGIINDFTLKCLNVMCYY